MDARGDALVVSNTNRFVMPGLDPGIHLETSHDIATWMAGSSPAMTVLGDGVSS
jgi:hypothetical protein